MSVQELQILAESLVIRPKIKSIYCFIISQYARIEDPVDFLEKCYDNENVKTWPHCINLRECTVTTKMFFLATTNLALFPILTSNVPILSKSEITFIMN